MKTRIAGRGWWLDCLVCAGLAGCAAGTTGTGMRESAERELISGAPVVQEPATADVLEVTRNPEGVPVVQVTGSRASTNSLFPPVFLLQKFSTWPADREVRCVNHEGLAILVLGSETELVAADEPPPAPELIENPPGEALERLAAKTSEAREALAAIAGAEAGGKGCELGAETITQYDGGRQKLRRVEVCDERCLTAYLACVGSNTSAALMQAIFAAWHQRNPDFPLPKADSRMNAWLDLAPDQWQKGAPWWLTWSAGVVPSAYGKRVLIGVGTAEGTGSLPRSEAQNRSVAEINKVLAVAVSKATTAAGRTQVTSAELSVRNVMPLAFFEHEARTYVMSMCDERCFLSIAKGHGVKLNADALAAAAVK
ncbi:MAG: hypothetical protein A2289_20475 [Deltaproteobacteria bacterium RIFOXYA12_FULL_58_15]|nr:MAG: hypothetical protein A2289_20475 [Deltaproteobacteria bacterium RIFOXYA12_FULL_58_15]